MMNPILAEQFQRPQWQRDIPIFSAFPLPEVNHSAGAIDILNLKMSPFLKPEPTGINRREASPMALQPDEAENPTDLVRAQDGRKLLFASRANKVEDGEIPLESMLEEELDAAQSDSERTAGVFSDILEVEKILSEFFLSDQVRGFVIVPSQLTHSLYVALLSPFREAPELETLDHSLSQLCHNYTS